MADLLDLLGANDFAAIQKDSTPKPRLPATETVGVARKRVYYLSHI